MKITTSQPLHGPYQQHNPDGPWWVEGVLYTDNPDVIRLCTRNGCTITEDSEPTEHTDAVNAMKDEAVERGIRSASTGQDDEMPTRYSYFTGRTT